MELLAIVIGLMVFAPTAPRGVNAQGVVTVTSLTDSQVASAVVGKMLTTSFPLCLIAMEAAAQMERRGYELSLLWVPREMNEEADALSNLRFAEFSMDRRIEVDLAKLPFDVLGPLMEQARSFYAGVKRRRPKRQKVWGQKKPSLRERDPW